MEKILTYDEFVNCNYWGKDGLPRHNNMYLYFIVLDESVYKETAKHHESLRQRPFYVEAERRNPALFGELVSSMTKGYERKVRGEITTMEFVGPLEPSMYEAYKYMREYGGTDDEIFM